MFQLRGWSLIALLTAVLVSSAMLLFGYTSDSVDESEACSGCEEWYQKDRLDTAWLGELNSKLKCPCAVRPTMVSFKLPAENDEESPAGGSEWTVDWSCMRYGLPLCSKFHAGADGCIRSAERTSTGARQQCCYTSGGQLIVDWRKGAGTPDRSGDFWQHQQHDVRSYELCCLRCARPGYCDLYMQLRAANFTHCQ